KFRRKNFYMPCILNARVDEMSDEEYADVLKATYWADNVTNAEWPVVLGHDDCSPSARSRLKKKAAGWLMALQRVGRLNPELSEEVVAKADEMYREQVEDEPVVRFSWDERLFVEPGVQVVRDVPVGATVDWHPVADPPQPDDEDGDRG